MIDYSDGYFSTEQLDDLWADLDLSGNETTLIITSPRPESIIASSLICRSYLKNHTPFTLTYAEPISDVTSIADISQELGASLTVVMGTEIHGSLGDSDCRYIFLGCDTSSDFSSKCLGSIESLASVSCAFADKIVSLNRWHIQLAAAVALVQKWRDLTPSTKSNKILQIALDEGILEQRKGLRLFGINHLSARDILQYSIYPYLPGLTGVAESCEKLIADANIPLSKRGEPIISLSNDEKERINEILIRNLPLKFIKEAFGKDYIFLHEDEDTPVRFISSLLPLLKTCWKILELGIAASVCIGDRSRLLHSLIESHIEICKTTTSGFHLLTKKADEGKLESKDNCVIVRDLGVEPTVLADIGRIAFDAGLFEPNHFLLLVSDCHTELVWDREVYTLNAILATLRDVKFRIKSTSPYSLRLFGGVDPSQIAELLHNEIGNTS
ncbi:MAG: hypothetical protein R6V83_10830 [Candidatus Thorarchaeota archaeon]